MDWFLSNIRPILLTVVDAGLAAAVSAHVILNKRDVRAAIAWAGLAWLAPFVGSLLYVLFGVNRIQRRALRLRGNGNGDAGRRRPTHLPTSESGRALHAFVEHISRFPLTSGNAVQPLVDGDEAYPAMLDAIAGARKTVGLTTYIFDYDAAGRRFVEALRGAVERGVEVRVLLDGVGARYSKPKVTKVLARSGVPVAEFLSRSILRNPYMNLRSHRKILVVDGETGFTGGMNIREGGLLATDPAHPIRDLHFRLEGAIVEQLIDVFAEDWEFTTRERLNPREWKAPPRQCGPVDARGIPDGPDEDFETLRWTLLGALADAQQRVRIVTPYFIPDQGLIIGLNVAAMRGVDVEIVIPAKGNLRFVQWASTAQLWQVLERGCRVWLAPPPFDHTKLVLVDDEWALVGSGNWDARSLRLNFEFNVGCFNRVLAATLHELVDAKVSAAHRVTLEDVDGRSLPVRLRDGVARLFSPYL